MHGRGNPTAPEGRTQTYCVVPWEIAAGLHDELRKHFAGDPALEVIVEHRARERRDARDRRTDTAPPAPEPAATAEARDRRRIRNVTGRRIGDRRAQAIPTAPKPLPRKARSHSERIVFLERIE